MKINIPYGKDSVEINVDVPFEILVPKQVNIEDENKSIENALQNPIGMNSFKEFALKSDKLLVIVNDASRPTPTCKILEYLHSILTSHPNVKFLIATGVHRAPTADEYSFIFGKTYQDFKDLIYVHDSRKKKDMDYLGMSKNGTKMYINKLVSEFKNVLVIGSVEPHYFAGYTGGRKSFLPGVASYETIEMNHKLALSDKACSLVLNGNPVHEDMVDAMNVLKDINVFSIQTVLTGDHKLFKVTAGDLLRSFDAAIEYSNQIFCVPCDQKGNIVISAAPYPMDIDLYQSQKALDNGKLVLEDDGIIILVSKCRTGVGEATFLELLSKAKTCKDVLNILGDEYKLGYHKAAKMAHIGLKSEIWAVTDIEDETMKSALMKPYNNIQKALDEAVETIKIKGKSPRVIILPLGSLTVPKMIGEEN